MLGRTEVPDRDLLRTVNQRLSRMGGGTEARLTASVEHGTVTLSGMLPYENQHVPVVKAVSNIPGVHRVIDQLRVLHVDLKKTY
jgi:osmotically-inducible protein OsmY